jgi:uncharacterized protein (DUF4415 family)
LKVSKTDWPRIKAMRDADIDLSEVPEVTADMATQGIVRVAGKIVPRGKKRLTMYLDAAVVEFFKARAGARGYQTLINEALKQAIERESLEDTLRRVIREETAVSAVHPNNRPGMSCWASRCSAQPTRWRPETRD